MSKSRPNRGATLTRESKDALLDIGQPRALVYGELANLDDNRNYGLGGNDGAIAVDLVNMQKFVMDNSTWQATIGAGKVLGDVSSRLHDAGGRAMAQGVCPGVGIGGHATIGGLGAMSRMWGSALDHVLEVEVVTSNGTILRANDTQNSNLFWVRPSSCFFACSSRRCTRFTEMNTRVRG